MKLDIMGLQFDNVTMDEAAARAEKILAGEKTCYVVTPNAEIAYEVHTAMHPTVISLMNSLICSNLVWIFRRELPA